MKRQHDGFDEPGKRPSTPLYWRDLAQDLQPLSDGAAGLWMKILCQMAMSSRRGYLVHPNGTAWEEEEILRLSGDDRREARRHFSELARAMVFSIDPTCRALYNRRMVRDDALSQKRRDAGNKGVEARKAIENRNFAENLVDQNSSKPLAHVRVQSFASASATPDSVRPSPENSASEPDGRTDGHSVTKAEIAASLAEFPHRPPGKPTAPILTQLAEKLRASGITAEAWRGLLASRAGHKPRSWRWFLAVAENGLAEGEFTAVELPRPAETPAKSAAPPAEPGCAKCADTGLTGNRGKNALSVAEMRGLVASGDCGICDCVAGMITEELADLPVNIGQKRNAKNSLTTAAGFG